MGYKSHNHCKYKIRYHIILSVKYHKKILAPIIQPLKQSIARAQTLDGRWKVEVVETDLKEKKDHHIHLLIKAKPQVSPYEIVHKIEQVTTFDLWKSCREYLSKHFWRGPHHLWTRGYFVTTIGEVSEKTLKHYIETQG